MQSQSIDTSGDENDKESSADSAFSSQIFNFVTPTSSLFHLPSVCTDVALVVRAALSRSLSDTSEYKKKY